MEQIKDIARRAGVQPQQINEALAELGYQQRTKSRNCRYEPTALGAPHCEHYDGTDAKGNAYRVYSWDDTVARVVVDHCRAPSRKEHALLQAEHEALKAKVAVLDEQLKKTIRFVALSTKAAEAYVVRDTENIEEAIDLLFPELPGWQYTVSGAPASIADKANGEDLVLEPV